jgi:hypothetical protein
VSITPVFQSQGFDPEAVELLGAAFDTAWQLVKTNYPYFASGPLAIRTREALAKHIIDRGMRGERDVRELVEGALSRIRLKD